MRWRPTSSSSLSHALHAVQPLVTSFVETSAKLQCMFVGGIRGEYRGDSFILHTWLVISLELLQQYKVDTEILVPVSVGDTWAFYKPW